MRVFSPSTSCIKTHAQHPKELRLTRRLRSFLVRGVFDIIFVWGWLSLKGIEESRLVRGQVIKAGAMITPRWTFPQFVTSLPNKFYDYIAVPEFFTSTLTNLLQVNVQVMPPPSNFRVIWRPVSTNSWSFETIVGFRSVDSCPLLGPSSRFSCPSLNDSNHSKTPVRSLASLTHAVSNIAYDSIIAPQVWNNRL